VLTVFRECRAAEVQLAAALPIGMDLHRRLQVHEVSRRKGIRRWDLTAHTIHRTRAHFGTFLTKDTSVRRATSRLPRSSASPSQLRDVQPRWTRSAPFPLHIEQRFRQARTSSTSRNEYFVPCFEVALPVCGYRFSTRETKYFVRDVELVVPAENAVSMWRGNGALRVHRAEHLRSLDGESTRPGVVVTSLAPESVPFVRNGRNCTALR